MLATALNAFFCMVAVLTIVKANGVEGIFTDVMFLLCVLIVMFLMNTEVLKKKCGESDAGTVAKATFIPWTVLLGGIIVMLKVLPGWKQPFSNTFGYLVVMLGGGKKKLCDMLQTDTTPTLQFVKNDPWALMVNFSTVSFDATLDALRKDTPLAEDKVAAFRKIVLLKDLVAEFVWFMLVGSVAITMSYGKLTAYKCQSAKAGNLNVAPVKTLMS